MRVLFLFLIGISFFPAFAQESTLDDVTSQLEGQINYQNLKELEHRVFELENKENIQPSVPITPTWIIAIATLIASIVAVASFIRQNKTAKLQNEITKEQNQISKQNIEYQGILEIMKIFNNEANAHKRNILYKNYREKSLYLENGEFRTTSLQNMAASVRGAFDNFGKLVYDGYVNKEQFLSMYCGSVIKMYKVLRLHIETQRKNRKSTHFAVYFEKIFEQSRKYWKEHFPDAPEPEPE